MPAPATLYVTLEPCVSRAAVKPRCRSKVAPEVPTEGCSELISSVVRKGLVCRVVVGCVDPNPRHCGAGLRALRDAGAEVVVGICATECRRETVLVSDQNKK